MSARGILGLAAFLAAAPTVVDAQDFSRPALLSGVEFRTVSFGTGGGVQRISELAVPLGFSLPVSRRIGFDVGTYFVSAQRTDAAGTKATISGLTDVVVRSAFQIKPDVAVFTLSVNVPTGKKTLDADQELVARSVATDLISFPVANFGTSLNVTSGLALAAPVGPWALGLAGSYRVNGSYTPFGGDTTTLKPGGEVRVRVGADRILGQGRVSLGLTYSTFQDDEVGGVTRSPGSRIIPQASWSVPMGNNSLSFYAWDVARRYKTNGDTSAATLAAFANENTIAAGAVLSLRMGRNSLRPLVEFRHAWKGGNSNGTLVGFGARYVMLSGTHLSITPGFRVDLGSYGLSSVSFTGLSASLGIRTTL